MGTNEEGGLTLVGTPCWEFDPNRHPRRGAPREDYSPLEFHPNGVTRYSFRSLRGGPGHLHVDLVSVHDVSDPRPEGTLRPLVVGSRPRPGRTSLRQGPTFGPRNHGAQVSREHPFPLT